MLTRKLNDRGSKAVRWRGTRVEVAYLTPRSTAKPPCVVLAVDRTWSFHMDYETEINDLKKRVEELETCCAEFRSCKGSMAERIEAVEKQL